jgi:hypothetical protein
VPALVAAVLISVVACGQVQTRPCFGLQRGDRIELTVIEPYDPTSHYPYAASYSASSCELGFDLADGQVLEATVVDMRSDDTADCQTGIAQMGPVGGWTWQLASQQSPPPDLLLYGSYAATMGQCTGSVQMKLHSDQTPFVPPIVGQVPHVLLERQFQGNASNPACPSVGTVVGTELVCASTFVVDAKKL